MSETIKAILTADSAELQAELAVAASAVSSFENKFKRMDLNMAAKGLGPLSGELQLAQGAMSQFKNEADKAGGALERAAGIARGFGTVAAAGIAAAAAGVAAAAKSAIDQGGALSDAMARTGAAGSNLVILGQQFENAGVSASKVPDAINKLQKALAGVNDEGESTANAFTELGLSVQSLTAMDSAMAFNSVAKAIGSLPDPAERAAAAMKLFGRSGAEFLAVMADPKGWETAASQVGILANALDANAAKFDELGDRLSAASIAIKTIGVNAAAAASGGLEWFAEAMEAINGAGAPDWSKLILLRSPFEIDTRALLGARFDPSRDAAADPGYLKSAREQAEATAAAQADAAAKKAYDESLRLEEEAAKAKEELIKSSGERILAAQESVYESRLSLEENLQRKLAQLDAEGRPTAAAINNEKDPEKAAGMAERLAESLKIEKALAAESDRKKAAAAAEAAAAAAKNDAALREAQSRAEAIDSLSKELEIQQALAAGEGEKAAALSKQLELAGEIQRIMARTGWDLESSKAFANTLENAKTAAEKLESLGGSTKSRGDARREARAEKRQADRDEANAEKRLQRELQRAQRLEQDQNRGEIGGLDKKSDKKANDPIDPQKEQQRQDRANPNKELTSQLGELVKAVNNIEAGLKKIGAA